MALASFPHLTSSSARHVLPDGRKQTKLCRASKYNQVASQPCCHYQQQKIKEHDVGWHDIYAILHENELVQKLKESTNTRHCDHGQKVRVGVSVNVAKVESSCIKIHPAVLDSKHADTQMGVIVQQSTLRGVRSINEVKVVRRRI